MRTKVTWSVGTMVAVLTALPALAGDGVRMLATWYGEAYRGKPTASGERFDPSDYTAAHPSLPYGTRLAVRNPADGRTVVVRINDRAPGRAGIDLSHAAARAIGLDQLGTAPVVIEAAANWYD
ncbi:MAG: septal ring lytic transglycosylase RlpA family protein [Solirubrobacterales bacterium]